VSERPDRKAGHTLSCQRGTELDMRSWFLSEFLVGCCSSPTDKDILLSLSIEFPFGCIRYSLVEPCWFQQMRHWFELDSQPDDAVYREPVSAPNSLLTGKNTGKFAKHGPSPTSALLSYLCIPASLAELPQAMEQGILGEKTGKAITQNREKGPPLHTKRRRDTGWPRGGTSLLRIAARAAYDVTATAFRIISSAARVRSCLSR
jgi:hypothetical protein